MVGAAYRGSNSLLVFEAIPLCTRGGFPRISPKGLFCMFCGALRGVPPTCFIFFLSMFFTTCLRFLCCSFYVAVVVALVVHAVFQLCVAIGLQLSFAIVFSSMFCDCVLQ